MIKFKIEKVMKTMTLIFEHLFNHIILQRGYDYYIYKKVKEIAIENDKITAKVMGSDEYSVEVVIENKQIKEMHCDCPYFDGGNNCKHIAAVLYMVRSTESTQIEKVEDDSIINLLDSLSHEELYRFLKEELQTNHDLKFKFKSKYDKSKDNKTVSWHLNHIDSIIDNHLGYDNFINYNDASDFEMDMDRVIEGISDLVENEQYHVAFEMIRHTINSLNNLDIDDSLGTTANIMRELVEILCGIIDETSGEIYEQIFQWLLEIVSGSTLDWMEDELIEVLMEYYNEEDKIAKKIKTVNRIISSMKVTESWSSKYELSKWVANKYILLNEAGNHDEEINQLFHDYAYLSSIRDILIENRLKNKEYQEAIDLLMEGKDIYSGSAGIVNDYSDKLIDIYRITNREKELFEESEKRLFEYSLNSMEAYLGYKKLYDE
ncbi:MAG: SWIM zinc finger family protein, partial [Bacillota bacterium]|nr:SWIM zinc finger family protein [Bacillota bacterium]